MCELRVSEFVSCKSASLKVTSHIIWKKQLPVKDTSGTYLSRVKYWHVAGLGIIRAVTWQNQQSDCAPSDDSDQPGLSPSLIGVFVVRMKKAWVLSYPLSAQRRLWSDWGTGQMPRLIWVYAGRTLILLVLSCCGSFYLRQVTTKAHFFVSIYHKLGFLMTWLRWIK